jgi:hypothetical protein
MVGDVAQHDGSNAKPCHMGEDAASEVVRSPLRNPDPTLSLVDGVRDMRPTN